MTMTSSVLFYRLGWTLVHSLWQILVIACVVGIVLSLLSRRSARLRYTIACLGLIGIYVPLVATYVNLTFDDAIAETSVSDSSRGEESLQPDRVRLDRENRPAASLAPASARPADHLQDAVALGSATARDETTTGAPRVAVVSPTAELAPPVSETWQRWLVVSWGIGVVLLGAGNMFGWLFVQRLRFSGTVVASQHVRSRMDTMARRLGIRQKVGIVESLLVDAPVVIGQWRPLILLPVSLVAEMPVLQLDAILAHELSHVRRKDYLVNLFQAFTESLLFYHPAVWLISRQVRIEREFCCDDAALAACDNKSSYLRALATIESQRGVRESTSSFAMSMTGSSRSNVTLLRARRLMGLEQGAASTGWAALLSIVLAVLLGSGVWLQQDSLAQEDGADESGTGESGTGESGTDENGADENGADENGQTQREEGRQAGQNSAASGNSPPKKKGKGAAVTPVSAKDFRLDLLYSGSSNKPFYNYTLSTVELESSAAENGLDVESFFWQRDRVEHDSPAVKRVIQWLHDSRFFEHSQRAKRGPDAPQKYLLKVTSAGKVFQEDLGFDLGTLIRLDSLQSVLSGADAKNKAKKLDLLLGRISGYRKLWTNPASDTALQWNLRLAATKVSAFRPIPAKLTVVNTGEKAQLYEQHAVSRSGSEILIYDSFGRRVPFVGGTSQLRQSQHSLLPKQEATIDAFDMGQLNYLRQPGQYVACYVGHSGARSNVIEFEVTPRLPGDAAREDGDLSGRLLSLVNEDWMMISDLGFTTQQQRPGYNYNPMPCEMIVFQHNRTGAIRDIHLAWFWFAKEKATPRSDAPTNEFPPPSDYLGKVDRWHIYFHAPDGAMKLWPTVLKDVKRAVRTPVTAPRATVSSRSYDLEFHKQVAATKLPIEIRVNPKLRRNENGVILEVTLENGSDRKITTTVAQEWHGGELPLTCMYATATTQNDGARTKLPLVPVYAQQPSKVHGKVKLEPGESQVFVVRMDYPGTGSVISVPLITKPGKYTVQLALVFEQQGVKELAVAQFAPVELLATEQTPENSEHAQIKTVKGPPPPMVSGIRQETGIYERVQEGKLHVSISNATDAAVQQVAAKNKAFQLSLNSDRFGRGIGPQKETPPLLTDKALEHISVMTNLRHLEMPTEGITDAGLVYLKDMTQLEELWLDFLPLSDAGVQHLGGLTKLKVLRFYGADITDIGALNFKDMHELEDLQLGKSLITDKSMPMIGQLKKLQTLDLRAKVTDKGMSHLEGLTELTWLCLRDTDVGDPTLAHVAKLKKLEWLIYSGTATTDAGLKELEYLPSLTTLYLDNTPITDTGMDSIATLTKLERVKLNKTKITDIGLLKLAVLKNLKEVEVRDTPITLRGVAAIQKLRPDLDVIVK